jgi:single-strand DNA-binding protein
VILIGNLTRDPELKYTHSGTAVCSFTVATNRQWKDSSGNEQDQASFHRCVAWSKLAEICGQYLFKGKKVYIDGRIQNRSWETQQGEKKYMTEIVVNEMIMLGDNRSQGITPQDAENALGAEDYPPEPEE